MAPPIRRSSTTVIILACSQVLLVDASLAQNDHCVAVYQTATRNHFMSEASYSSLNTIFDDYCNATGEVKSSATSVGFEALASKLPLKFAGQTASSQTRVENFCRSYSSVRYDTAASGAQSDTVVVDALRAFNDCLAISRANVRVIHTAPTGLEGTFSFQFGSGVEYRLQGVQTGTNLKCQMQSPNGELVDLGRSSNLTFRETFSAFCNREPHSTTADGRKTYPRTSVTFASNHGPFSVIYPEEEVQGVEFATAITSRMQATEARLTQLAMVLEESKKDTVALIDSKTGAVKTQLDTFRKNLNVKVLKVMVGEHRVHGLPHWYSDLGCGDVNAWAKNQCPNHEIFPQMISTRHGDKCGYTYYVITCVGK